MGFGRAVAMFSFPQLKSILSALPATTGLAMLGDLLIDDPFYQLPQLSRRVIPHGFFDLDTDILSRPVVIGRHTTWGEMRSVKRTLALLKAIAEVRPRTPVIGYLGGTPAEALSRKSVSAHLEHFDLNKVFILRDFKTEDWREEVHTATPNTIFSTLEPQLRVLMLRLTYSFIITVNAFELEKVPGHYMLAPAYQ